MASDLMGLQRVFAYGLCAGIPGAGKPLKRAKTGLAGALRALRLHGQAWAGSRCLFSLYESTVLDGYTVPQGMA